MKIILIAACGKNRELGKDGKMPWHLPADLALFKKNTLNQTVIMGRKTFASLGNKALPKRDNFVITRQNNFSDIPNLEFFTDINSALLSVKTDIAFIIGGGEIYKQSIDLADELYITHIDANFDADTFFPEISKSIWEAYFSQEFIKDEKNNFDFKFIKYARKY